MKNDKHASASDDFGSLALRFLDGDLSPGQRSEFAERIAQNVADRDAYIALCIQSGRFAEHYAADDLTIGEPDAEDELTTPRRQSVDRRPWQRFVVGLSRPGSISLLIAALVIGGLLGVLAWNNAPSYQRTQLAGNSDGDEAQFVARLVHSPEARWKGQTTRFADGTLLRSGERLELASGIVDVVFNSGAQATIEGPATFVVTSASRGELEQGRLTGNVPRQAKGFTIRTPQVDVIDLGTQFGVVASSVGQTEVHVFQGAVRVEAYDFEKRRILRAGQGLKIVDSGQMIAQAAAASAFVLRPLVSEGDASADKSAIRDDFDNPLAPQAGWAGPWSLHGQGRVYREANDPLGSGGKAYLRVEPTNPETRSLRRAFQAYGDIDPSRPHIVRWKWRFDGDAKALTNFHDRIHFFADAQPVAGTAQSNAWLIAIAFGIEGETRPPVGKWVFFDSRKSGEHSDAFTVRNMVETGMKLRPGAVYSFEVRVDPARGTYGATIDDGVERFAAEGLHFRSGQPGPTPALHFGGCASVGSEDQSFSLDSIEITPVSGNSTD